MAHNVKMKTSLIQLIQQNKFHGFDYEDPFAHLTTFVRICNTVKIHQVDDDFIRISLFPFSLSNKAKHFCQTIPPNIPLTWDEICDKFFNRF